MLARPKDIRPRYTQYPTARALSYRLGMKYAYIAYMQTLDHRPKDCSVFHSYIEVDIRMRGTSLPDIQRI
jgi:hypothetical protein